MQKRILVLMLLVAIAPAGKADGMAQDLGFSGSNDAVRFAVIGDSGTGGRHQQEIADQMLAVWKTHPFSFVLMLGDNIYGGESPKDIYRKFEHPYASLLKSGVKFYASLGNHDEPAQSVYPPFNMEGHRYYTLTRAPYLRAISLDSSKMDPE